MFWISCQTQKCIIFVLSSALSSALCENTAAQLVETLCYKLPKDLKQRYLGTQDRPRQTDRQTDATSWKVMCLIPDEVIGLFNWPNPSSHIMALGLTQSLTEMSTRHLPGGKGWPAHKADNLTATCEPVF
jgi:hypothetical protein